MTAIALKTINFNSAKLEKGQDCKIEGQVKLESAKNLAYVIRWQLARKRSGSAKIKSMAEISGTTAKPYRQKGTGNARQGSKRSVQFVGGRTCHGPTPRSYDFSIPKKIAKKALADALKIKIQEGKAILFSEIADEKMKTSALNKALKVNNINSALILVDSETKNAQALAFAARNIKNVKALDAEFVNAYDVLKYDYLIIDSKAYQGKILTAIS